MLRSILIAAAAATVLALAGCPKPVGGVVIDPNGKLKNCKDSSECPSGNVCVAGVCDVGVCDPTLTASCRDHSVKDADKGFCCKPWELCDDAQFTCKNDPSVKGIGCDPNDKSCTPCQTQDDCAAGQFCSGAACYDTAGRQTCESSFQCPSGQRCDRNVFLCVPDLGGCTFCGPDFPELCCETTQTCSQQSGFCVDQGDQECQTAGSTTECAQQHPGTKCDGHRCVQCTADADCGPGLKCDTGTGTCFPPQSRCQSDSDCSGDLKCATASGQCVAPQCTTDADCAQGADHRRKCDPGSFTCILPPPVCTETDEPNNDPSQASQMTSLTQPYQSTLCRNDTDVIAFPVQPNLQYVVKVDFGGSGEAGIGVQLLNTSLQIESSSIFGQNDGSIEVVGLTGPSESGNFYVRLQGNNPDRDEWNYTITVSEGPPPPPADCSAAGQPEEPNDDFSTATPLVVGQTKTFSRCGLDDVDFFQVPISRLHGAQITLGGFTNAAGNLNLTVFTSNSTGSALPGGNSTNDAEQVTGPEGPSTYFMKVALANSNGAVTNQTYNITVNEVARPAACSPDATEDDGLIANAFALNLVNDAGGNPTYFFEDGKAPDGTDDASALGPIRCNPQDLDLFRFTMPPNLGGTVQLHFNQNEGTMAVDLLDAGGNQIATSSTPSYGVEQVSVPGGTSATDYVIRARIASCAVSTDPNCVKATGGIVGQHYGVEIRTFDNAQCIASEPNGGDDTFFNGRCIGANYTSIDPSKPCTNAATPIAEPMAPTSLSACVAAQPGTVDGCGLVCGNSDTDYYRVGILQNDQVLHAHLTYDPNQGLLALGRQAVTSTDSGATVDAQTVSDNGTHPTGAIDLTFIAPTATATSPAKEYGVRVKTSGTTGHQVQPYALTIEVGPECVDDVFDAGAATNDKPSESTIIRPNPVFNQPFTFDSTQDDPAIGYQASLPLSHCQVGTTADVDVYELFSFQGETVNVTLTQIDDSPTGLQAELGTRPANLDNPAVSLSPPLVATSGSPISFTNPETQQLYVTVKTPAGVTVTGPYVLVVTTTP